MAYRMLASDEAYLWHWVPRLRKWRMKTGVVCREPRNRWERFLVKHGLWEYPIRNKFTYKEKLDDHDRIDLFSPLPEDWDDAQ